MIKLIIIFEHNLMYTIHKYIFIHHKHFGHERKQDGIGIKY